MTTITDKRLEKVKILENMFKRFEKSGLPPTVFCRRERIHTSKFYYWRDRHQEMGTKGLIDRREGVPYKITEEVREYIRDVKKKDKLKSGSSISYMIKNKFGKKVSVFHVQRVIKKLGLNDPVGRKPGKPIKKTSDS